MLYELDIIDAVCNELVKRGYLVVSRKSEHKHTGSDIIAKKVDSGINLRFFIEAVGETSSQTTSTRHGKPFNRSQIKVHLSELLFTTAQTLSMQKIDGFDYKVGLAIPDNKDHREMIASILPFLESVKIVVFFVQEGHIEIVGSQDI